MKTNQISVDCIQQKGFTLLEVIIVIVLIAILASVAVLSLGGNRKNAEEFRAKMYVFQVQSCVRAYQATHNLENGATLASTAIIGDGKCIEAESPASDEGTWTYGAVVPAYGTAYATSSKANDNPTAPELKGK